MQKTHDSQCQGPGKTSLLLGVGVFASALDQSGAKRGVAHIRLRAVGSWEVVPGWSRSRQCRQTEDAENGVGDGQVALEQECAGVGGLPVCGWPHGEGSGLLAQRNHKE